MVYAVTLQSYLERYLNDIYRRLAEICFIQVPGPPKFAAISFISWDMAIQIYSVAIFTPIFDQYDV